jgi:short-subunit dehydrogenase
VNQENIKTALITGASSGIGEEFARQLARRGYQLILVARRQDRLLALASELDEKCNVTVQVLPLDLATEEGTMRAEECIRTTPDLELLVNNAGFGFSGYFGKINISQHLKMIQVHVSASVRLTHAAIPGLISKNRGGIINVASVAAFVPWGNVTYNATKAYLVAFSEALNVEMRRKNVRVQALCPGFTETEFHDSPELSRIRNFPLPKSLWLSSEFVVAESLKALDRGKVICIPGFLYWVIAGLGRSPLFSPLLRAAMIRRRK